MADTVSQLLEMNDRLRNALQQYAPQRKPSPAFLVIGLAGNIGAGKSVAARMIPDACHLQWADPLYSALAAMLDVPVDVLHDRGFKDTGIVVDDLHLVPRDLLRTLGTEWGRDRISPDIWVRLTMRRIKRLAEETHARTFAVCGTRFPNEAAAIRQAEGEVWWIDRPGTERGQHSSDVALASNDCDRVIVNNGSMDALRRAVESAYTDFLAR